MKIKKEESLLNLAISYFLMSKQSFPQNSNNVKKINDFFEFCSNIKYDCEALSEVAATLSNGGVNPFTDQPVLSKLNVDHIFKSLKDCGYNK